MKAAAKTALIAWLVTAFFYFYQYALRSAPAVMMPQLSEGFGLTAMAVASLVGLFYYGYAPFSLVAGVALDRLGPRKTVPLGAAAVGLGAILFAVGGQELAGFGRFLQGAGGAFALVGAVFIATSNFPASRAATFIGATQMFGMAGGSAGQFVVGPIMAAGTSWRTFWLAMGIGGLAVAAMLVFLIPREETRAKSEGWVGAAGNAIKTVFSNPQSILCGLIAGLLAMPTTIFDMVWGVRFLQDAHGIDYGTAVIRSATVPAGWIIGCPLLGFISDRIGRRKPVILGGAIVLLCSLAWILYGPVSILPPYILGLIMGTASGAVMLPYTVIKEANPSHLGGTATGVINFINFTLTALLGPIFARVLAHVSAGSPIQLEHYQATFRPMLFGVALAIVLTVILRETGPAARAAVRPVEATS